MLSYDEMPADNNDLAKIDIDFPHLADNSPATCPVPMKDILEYLEMESPSGENLTEVDLEFLRTAQVAEYQFWIWRFFEPANDKFGPEVCYVTVSSKSGGYRCVGYGTGVMDWDEEGNASIILTPEQYMLGVYHEVF